MRPIFYLLAYSYSTTLVGAENNWMIDDSCNKVPGMLDFVQQSVINALAMSQAAYSSVTEQPMNAAEETALNFLFADLSIGREYGEFQFGPTGVGRLTNQVSPPTKLLSMDVKIYCDQSRLKRVVKPDKTFWLDTDIDYELTDDQYEACSFFTSSPTLMYTLLPLKKHAQIQICPTFLTWAMPAPNRWTVLLSPSYWTKITVELAKRLKTATSYTPIDALSLFDKVMVHELTHTNLVHRTVDVAYGWQLCRQLAPVVSQPSTGSTFGDPLGPEVNADTWALFASIAWELRNNRITGINADGSFSTVAP